MAFVRDNEKLKKAMQGTVLSSGGMGGGLANIQQRQITAPTQASTGARAPLLADYLRANVGSGMGERVAGTLERQAQSIEQGKVSASPTGEVTVTTQTGAKAPSAAQQQVLGAGIYQRPGKGVGPVDGTVKGDMFTGQAGFAPTQAIMSGQQAQQRAQGIESSARAAGQEGGGQSLLQQQFGKGQAYSAGEQALDAALLGATTGGRLQQLSKKYSDLYGQLTGRIGQAQAAADDERRFREAQGMGRTTTAVSDEEMQQFLADREARAARARDAERVASAETSRQRMKLSPSDSTRAVTEEVQAARQGMTLEEWIRAGRP